MIGPIRGNSWRLLISLSLRLRVVGSVLRQLPTNRDMDLFLGMKVPYIFCDLGRSVNAWLSRFTVSYQFFSTSFVRQEEFAMWKYRSASMSAFRRFFLLKTKDEEKKKKAKMKRNTRAEKLLTDVKILHVS